MTSEPEEKKMYRFVVLETIEYVLELELDEEGYDTPESFKMVLEEDFHEWSGAATNVEPRWTDVEEYYRIDESGDRIWGEE